MSERLVNDGTGQYQALVVGKGLMGAAMARHLASSGVQTALVGPDEPLDKKAHTGVFASHYDEGRITRSLDVSADWGLLARRSISRYRQIEAESGIRFFSDVGAMMAGPETGSSSDFIKNAYATGRTLEADFEPLRGEALSSHFPFLSFPDDTLGLYEPQDAGYVSPRNLVKAQTIAAQRQGAEIISCEVDRLEERSGHVDVHCRDGRVLTANQVAVAAGGFSNKPGLLPAQLPLKVYARTIVFFHLSQEEAGRLRTMPSLVLRGLFPDASDPYVLPPVLYPDGAYYLKIGGDLIDVTVDDQEEIKAWFRADGSTDVKDMLEETVNTLLPTLRYSDTSLGTCVTTFSPNGQPIIERVSPRLCAVTAGNGAGAKSSDELGRLGAHALQGLTLNGQGYTFAFANVDQAA